MIAALHQAYQRTTGAYDDLCTRLYVHVNSLHTDEEGQGLVEYILIVLIILVVVIAALEFFFGAISRAFFRAGARIDQYHP